MLLDPLVAVVVDGAAVVVVVVVDVVDVINLSGLLISSSVFGSTAINTLTVTFPVLIEFSLFAAGAAVVVDAAFAGALVDELEVALDGAAVVLVDVVVVELGALVVVVVVVVVDDEAEAIVVSSAARLMGSLGCLWLV